VVDAFENSSNRVHTLIETVSPRTSLEPATNYTDLATNYLLKSLAPTISNTVTKAYVESLGIESGVDAQTVTNMTALTPVYSQTPTFTEWVWEVGLDAPQPTYIGANIWQAVIPSMGGILEADGAEDAISLSFSGGIATATRERTDIIGYTLGTQTNSVLAATNSISASTITNLAPTRAEVEAGWWSEGTVMRDGIDVSAQVGQPKWSVDIDAWDTSLACAAGDSNSTFGYAQSGQTSEENDTIGWSAWTDGETTEVFYTATRHRVASPVPTKISDLTNDVGYVPAATATNIAQSALGDFAATGTVSWAEGSDGATVANKAKSLDDDNGDERTASQIFAVLDESASTNYADTAAADAVASADTSYRRFVSLTNINQSVQYVNITDTAPTTLAISMPADGATKDWMVYVVSVTNVTLSLSAATWWMADTAYTNDVPPATPTALWFSQVADGVFILGRQELTPVSIEGGN
jgi:hypothetical protein